MATTTKRASPANLKVLFTALLCAAAVASSLLPLSSAADASLIDQTCRRTSDPHLCEAMLDSSNQTREGTTVRDLAAVAVRVARRSVLLGSLRALDLLHEARDRGAPADPLVAQCSHLYKECLKAGAHALSMVDPRFGLGRTYETVAADDAVAALRRFPERCAHLFRRARRAASPLENENTEMEEKLVVASEIVHSLR